MKRFGIFAIALLAVVGLVAAFSGATVAADQLLSGATATGVAIPAAELAVPMPENGEWSDYDAGTGAGLCCQFDESCTGDGSFVEGDSAVQNLYWTEVADAASETFLITAGVSPTQSVNDAIITLQDAPVSYDGLTPGTNYLFCVGVTYDITATPPLCGFYSGGTVDGFGNGLSLSAPIGNLNINCPAG